MDDRLRRDPEGQRGCELIGAMVKRRRFQVGWSQRSLSAMSGVSQSMISRLENGRLRGISFGRFGRLIAALNGLDRDAPLPRLSRQRTFLD
ncbi:MAG: helix-turn-helix transcriptional regulator [Candidatus Limnocylindrales bacterium]